MRVIVQRSYLVGYTADVEYAVIPLKFLTTSRQSTYLC